MSTTLDALLAKHHIGVASEAVLAEPDAAFAAVPGAGAAPVSPSEVEFLRRQSGGTPAMGVRP